MYKSEANLVQEFTRQVSVGPSLHMAEFATEFDYVSGRTDVVGRSDDGDLFAFEAKLTKWKDALHQAYRNSAFAHYSYVVLPEQVSQTATRCRREFERRGVGLCTISSGELRVEIKAKRQEPILPWLTVAALGFIGT